MTTPNKYSPSNNVQPPRCSKCSGDLTEVGTWQWTKQLGVGVAMILAIYCPNAECRTLLGQQIFIVPKAQEPGAIVGPH